MNFNTLPAVGQPLDAGTFAGVTTKKDGTHCAVVLLADTPGARVNWDAAQAWAASLQAELPTRPVAALLFANLPESFEKAWHWTSEEDADDGSSAWSQHFGRGFQLSLHKSYEARARAVRLIHLDA